MREEQKKFFDTMLEFRKLNVSSILPGVSHGDHMIMQSIGCLERKGDGSVKVSQVVRSLGMPAPTVSRGLRTLDQKGYITRTVDESDRRNTFVVLTDDGKKVLEEADRAVESLLDAIFDNMGEETMAKLNESFRRFVDASREEVEKRKSQK